MELFHEDSGMTTHTTGTGSAPGFEANGVQGAVELCGLTSLPRKSVAPRRSGLFYFITISVNHIEIFVFVDYKPILKVTFLCQ